MTHVADQCTMDSVAQAIEALQARNGHENLRTVEAVLRLALEIAREGREGQKIGTIFVIGDTQAVLKASRPLILDPLLGHPDERKQIDDPNLRETVKELAQLDGAFVVSDEGVMVSAARYLGAPMERIDLPLGLGTRHMAAAAITRHTGSVAVVVSKGTVVRLFDDGAIIAQIRT